MLTHAPAEFRIRAGVSPGVQLDRGIAKVEALVDHVEVLLDASRRSPSRRRPGSLGDSRPGAAGGQIRDAAREVPQRGVDHAEDVDGKLLGAVELPQAVPQPLPLERVAPTSSSRRTGRRCPAGSGRSAPGVSATPSAPQAVLIRSTAPSPAGGEPAQTAPPDEGRLSPRNPDRVGLDVSDVAIQRTYIHQTSVVCQVTSASYVVLLCSRP